MLLDVYPGAVKQNIDFYGTPLHQTACQTQNRKQIISILYDAYPEAASLAAKGTLWLPLHASADLGNYLSICELYKLYPEAVSRKDAEGSLPLHILLANKDPVMYTFAPTSEETAALRFLLSKHPAAVGVANGLGRAPSAVGHTAYDISVREGLNPHVRRLLLRARPETDPEELHRLNYAERRGAMFLAFSAVYPESGTMIKSFPVLRRFVDLGHMDVLKHVVTYL
jgi:hypothetical protein